MSDHLATLPSGAQLGVSAAGDPLAERLVLLCLPTPGAGMFDPDPEVTNRWGVHLVAVDRPGYGATPAEPGPGVPAVGSRIEDRADELAAYLLAARQTARGAQATADGPVGAIGWGTGALVALALAERHPELVDRVALVSAASDGGAPAGVGGSLTPPAERRRPPFGLDDLGIRSDDPLLDRPGLRHRLERMLATAAEQGEAGIRRDEAALATAGGLGDRARAAAGAPDADRILRIADTGPLAVVEQWARILEHVAPEHGGLAESTRTGA